MQIDSENQSCSLSVSDWRKLSAEWESSQETQKSFCAKRDVNYAKFVQKRSQFLLEKGRSRLNTFAKVTVSPAASSTSTVNRAPVNISLPNGLTITTFPDSDIRQLKAILVMLGAVAC